MHLWYKKLEVSDKCNIEGFAKCNIEIKVAGYNDEGSDKEEATEINFK